MVKSKKQVATRKRTTRKSTKGKRKKVNHAGRKLIFKISLFCFIITGIITSLIYLYINKQVETFLQRGTLTKALMVYSDIEIFPPKNQLSQAGAEKILLSLDYRRSSSPKINPGEFFIDQNNLSIHTREFISPSAQLVNKKITNFALNNRKEIVSRERIQIEPRPLGPLNQANLKSKKFVSLNDFPPFVLKTLVNTEDERFYDHFGIDPIGILRALVTNVIKGRLAQGGSTLNQQLAKNLFFSAEKTFKRKFLEVFAAISLEKNLTKEQILEIYLNEVYLGQSGAISVHGFPAASQFFFNKPIESIHLSEAALLAGLIKAPSYYNPNRHFQRAIERRDLVLTKLLENNIISNTEYLNAKAFPIKISSTKLYKTRAPFFMQALVKEITKNHSLKSLENSALRIQTGLSKYLQNCGEQAVSNGLKNIIASYPQLAQKNLEIGLVSLETFSGKVKTWVGGKDYSSNQFDHVSQASRQVGSTIKPFVYLTALDSNLNDYRTATAITILSDEPISIKQLHRDDPWTPKNYDGNFRGAVTLRYALEKSLNIPAVYVSQKVGLQNVANTIESFGIVGHAPPNPSIALGALEANLLSLTSAYAALANGGRLVNPRLYTSLIAETGGLIAINNPIERQVASEEATYVLTNILQGAIARGTGSAIRKIGFSLPSAGKTGTTNDARDAWFIGYTPRLATGIWIGADDNKAIGVGGGQVAAPIWANYMQCAQAVLPDEGFITPKNVHFVDIDSESGRRYDDSCEGEPISEVFIAGTEPPTNCDDQNVSTDFDNQLNPLPRPNPRRSLLDLIFN